jgi:hypothetical protein
MVEEVVMSLGDRGQKEGEFNGRGGGDGGGGGCVCMHM